jgi:hypothetical protein
MNLFYCIPGKTTEIGNVSQRNELTHTKNITSKGFCIASLTFQEWNSYLSDGSALLADNSGDEKVEQVVSGSCGQQLENSKHSTRAYYVV